jgi:hypothetical protein
MRTFVMISLRVAALLVGAALIGASVVTNPAVAGDVHAMIKIFGLTTCNSPSPCTEYQNTGSGPAMKADGTSGNGLVASANGRAGVVSTAGSGQGVTAISKSNDGVQGTTENPSLSDRVGRFGVYGFDGSTDHGVLNVGVYGSSPNGFGVEGSSVNGIAVEGDSKVGYGVVGSTLGNAAGVYAKSGTQGGIGVLSISNSSFGVNAQTVGTTATAIYGLGLSGGDGVDGISNNGNGYGVFATSPASALFADDMAGDPMPAALVQGGDTLPTDNSLGAFDGAASPTFWVDNGGNAHVRGLLFTGGSCSVGCSKTKGSPPAQVVRYTPQEAVPTIEDVGEAQLSNGAAYVRIDPAFANVIDADSTYLVFVTPQGLTRGLYVTEKTARGFEVLEQPGGRSSVAFDYRIVAKPFGESAPRLPMLTSAQLPKAPAVHSESRARGLKP